MRLYHSRFLRMAGAMGQILLLAALLASGCTAPQATQALIAVLVNADGQDIPLYVPAGSTAQQALDQADLALGPLDRTDPPLYTVLSFGSVVRLVRVKEEFEVSQVVIPFAHHTLRNESLPEGAENEIYLQTGKNGLQEITYRRLSEDGVEVSRAPIKSVIVEEPVPEIVMIGIQSPFFPVAVPGRLIYLRDGNAWMIEETTGNRQALVTTGDLDGRVLSLSEDQTWLLFTRRSEDPEEINTLWAMDISIEDAKLINLKVSNVVHFADWMPGTNEKVIFSTVEPRTAAPGWQANNDLHVIRFSSNGWIMPGWDTILEPNTGGVYGWWGTSFTWGPNSDYLAFSRPDGVGILDLQGVLTPTLRITPFQTRGDWAWVPGVAWGPDGNVLYTVDHVVPPGTASPEESQVFNLSALPLGAGIPIYLASQTGMFAYPLASPLQPQTSDEVVYQIAYLQATYPVQSETSRYRLAVMDRDGSNRKTLFPAEGATGLGPQREWGAWSPGPLPESGNYSIAVIYQGNLWLIDAVTGKAQQVTGDGLTTRILWK